MPDHDPLDADLLDPLFVSPAEAARLLGLSRQQVYDLLNEGRLEGRRHGTRRLVLLRSVESFADSLPA